MTDTPEHVKQLQLQIWLAKSPMERLRQMMLDNEALFTFWNNAKPNVPHFPTTDKTSSGNVDPK
jgi:hypothetical protein